MRNKRKASKVLVGKTDKRDRLGDLEVDGKIILIFTSCSTVNCKGKCRSSSSCY